MNEQEFLIDDRGIIPDDIKNMTKEELDAEIAKFEAETAEKRHRLEQRRKETA